MSFEVSVDGEVFGLWESASVTRSIDSNAGSFRLTNSSTTPISEYPMKVGDKVKIIIDDVKKVVGYIDDFSEDEDDGTHTVTISGRDNIQDLIDSSVPDTAKVSKGPITLKALCEKVIAAIGAEIEVVNKVDGIAEFTTEDLQAAGTGEMCMEFLVSFARKRQVYLVADGTGKMLIYRPDTSNKANQPLIHKKDNAANNVKRYSKKNSNQHRFNKYIVKSQDNFGNNTEADYSDAGTNRSGEAIDSEIRPTRILEIQAEESMTDAECKERAAEEANVRRAQGLVYTAIVAGTTQYDGTTWDFGQFLQVDDDFAGVVGEFLIKEVNYNIDVNSGTLTTLTCVQPDAYQVTAEASKEVKRSSTI